MNIKKKHTLTHILSQSINIRGKVNEYERYYSERCQVPISGTNGIVSNLVPRFLRDSNRNNGCYLYQSFTVIVSRLYQTLRALIIPGGTIPHEAVAFCILARKPIYLELVLRTPGRVASTHLRKITLIFCWSVYRRCFFQLLKKNEQIESWTPIGQERFSKQEEVRRLPHLIYLKVLRMDHDFPLHSTENYQHSWFLCNFRSDKLVFLKFGIRAALRRVGMDIKWRNEAYVLFILPSSSLQYIPFSHTHPPHRTHTTGST